MQETPNFDPIGAARDAAYKSLRGICDIAAKDKPGIGRRVEIINGKHKGKIGIVFWHGKDRFKYDRRYMTDLSACVADARGIYGFRVGVQTESEKFFVAADKVKIIE
jgi:hypothetical protein